MKHMDTAKKRRGWRQALALLITLVLVCGLAAPAYANDNQVETESAKVEQELLPENNKQEEEVTEVTPVVSSATGEGTGSGAKEGTSEQDKELKGEEPKDEEPKTEEPKDEEPKPLIERLTDAATCAEMLKIMDEVGNDKVKALLENSEDKEKLGERLAGLTEDENYGAVQERLEALTLAEDSLPVEEEAEQDPAVTELYNNLMNSKTLEEFASFVEAEDYEALSEQFTDEQWVAVNAKYEELSGIAAMLLADYSVAIENNVKEDGRLTATLTPAVPEGATVRLIWTKDGAEVSRTKVTGEEYNLAEDGSWLNVAYDNVDNNNVVRATYAVSSIEITIGEEKTIVPVDSDSSTVEYNKALQNGSFETPANTSNQNNRYNGANGLYWKTTDVDHGVEIVSVDYNACDVHGVVTVPHGSQAAEINAEDDAALYQDVLTTPGSTMYWSLMHMGRIASSGFNLTGLPTSDGEGQRNTDTMYVVIMSTDTAETCGNGGGEVDTYAEVSAIMANPDQYPGVQVTTITYTWYWVRSTSGWTQTYTMHYVDANGIDSVVGSVSRRSWGSWKKSNFKNVWQNTTGSYTVPENQYMTRYFFVSGSTAAKNNTIGNMVDDIWFSTEIPKPAPGTANLSVQKTLEGIDSMTAEQLSQVKNGLSFTVTFNGKETNLSGNDLNWNGNVGTWYTSTQVPANSSVAYTVTENNATAPDGYNVTLPEETTKAGSLSDRESFTASFTNTYAPANTTVTVKKTVDGGLGDTLKNFEFTVNVQQNGVNVPYMVGDSEKTGSSTFELRHNRSVELTAPIGATVTVTETDYGEGKGGYTTSYKVNGAEEYTLGSEASVVARNNATIEFLNHKEASPDTGVLLDSLPYVLILAAVAVAAVLMLSRKRRNRDAD